MIRLPAARAAAAGLSLALIAGCTDSDLRRLRFGRTAIVLGDFDTVEQLIQEIANDTTVEIELHRYDGYTDGPHWETNFGDDEARPGIQVEDLVRADVTEGLDQFQTTFFSCGMRGVGAHVYNGVGEDNHLVLDGTVVENVVDAARRGNSLYFSDWTYDLLEAAWPEMVDWVGEDEDLDAAQRGRPGEVSARVVSEALAEAMEVPVGAEIELVFNQGGWAVPEAVADEVEVLVEGEVQWDDADGGAAPITSTVPLVLAFPHGDGKVVFTAFHNEAQITDDARDVLRYELGQLAQ